MIPGLIRVSLFIAPGVGVLWGCAAPMSSWRPLAETNSAVHRQHVSTELAVAQMWERQGQRERAKEIYASVLEEHPQQWEAARRLERLADQEFKLAAFAGNAYPPMRRHQRVEDGMPLDAQSVRLAKAQGQRSQAVSQTLQQQSESQVQGPQLREPQLAVAESSPQRKVESSPEPKAESSVQPSVAGLPQPKRADFPSDRIRTNYAQVTMEDSQAENSIEGPHERPSPTPSVPRLPERRRGEVEMVEKPRSHLPVEGGGSRRSNSRAARSEPSVVSKSPSLARVDERRLEVLTSQREWPPAHLTRKKPVRTNEQQVAELNGRSIGSGDRAQRETGVDGDNGEPERISGNWWDDKASPRLPEAEPSAAHVSHEASRATADTGDVMNLLAEEPLSEETLEDLLERFDDDPKHVVPELQQRLLSDHPGDRSLAAYLLGRAGAEAHSTVAVLERQLSAERNAFVRIHLAEALVMLSSDDETGLNALLETLLDDPDKDVRWLAACALETAALQNRNEAVAKLARGLEDGDARVRSAVALTLGAFGSDGFALIPDLLELVEQDDHLEVREAAAIALACIAPAEFAEFVE